MSNTAYGSTWRGKWRGVWVLGGPAECLGGAHSVVTFISKDSLVK